MAKIDKMLQMIQERGVERAILRGDKPFQIFSSGKMVEGSLTPAAQLMELLEEIVPATSLPALRGGGTFHFRHACAFGDYDFGVENFLGALQVSIAPAKRQGGAPPASSVPLMPATGLRRELYVHRGGQNIGPLTPEQAKHGVQSGQYALHDLAIAPHMKDWNSLQNVLDAFGSTPIATVSTATVMPASSGATNLLRSFLNEEQDPSAVTRVIERLQQLCTPDETIFYIAVQKKPVVTVAPISVALTSKRVIIFRPKAMGLGLTFEDFPWRTVVNIHISEAILGSVFTVQLTNNRSAFVDSLPKAQARKLYQFGQQMEEHMYSHRRDLMLEEKRAGAGGVNVNINNTPGSAPSAVSPAPQSAADDPVEKLRQLKTMLDHDLISQADYDAKKAEIMSRF